MNSISIHTRLPQDGQMGVISNEEQAFDILGANTVA